MKPLLRSKKGATSVMLLLLLLVLIIFGLLAFMSAYANFRLGQSGQAWYQGSYQLDSQGEALLAQVDGVLARAEAQARDAVVNDALPDEVRVVVDSSFTDGDAVRAEEMFGRLYLYFAAQGLSELGLDATQATPSFVLVYGGDADSPLAFMDFSTAPADPALTLSGTLTSLDGRRVLSVDCAITPPQYSFSLEAGTLAGMRDANTARYRVARWQQSQPPLGPAGGFDGTIK